MEIINPSDWYALEQALDIKEEKVTEVTALALGDKNLEHSLRWCLAAGADQAIRIWDEALRGADLLGKGRVLASFLRQTQIGLLLSGDECLDGIETGLPGIAAAAANMAFVPGVEKIEKLKGDEIVLIRKLEKGKRERAVVRLPAALSLRGKGSSQRCDPELPALLWSLSQQVPYQDLVALGLSPHKVGSWGAKVRNVLVRVYKPVTIKPPTPNSELPANQRLKTILDSGLISKDGKVLTGDPEALVAEMMNFVANKAGGSL